jgi:hypothetical protein
MSSSAHKISEPRARSVKVTGQTLTVGLSDGRTIMVPLDWFPRLAHGTPRERSHFEIFGDGAHLHWPDLDEDLTVEGLLAGRRSGESPSSFRKWLDARKDRLPRRGSRRAS